MWSKATGMCLSTIVHIRRAYWIDSVYVPAIFVLNKIDAISIEELDLLYKVSCCMKAHSHRPADSLLQIPNSVPISSKNWLNIDELNEVMWEKLDLVRVYTKPRGQQPDYSSPVVLRRSKCTVEDFCNAIHKEIVKQFRTGKCGGDSEIISEAWN